MGLNSPVPGRKTVGLSHFLGLDALGNLPNALTVEFRYLLCIVGLTGFHSQGFVGGEEFLIEFVVRIKCRVIENELHDLEQVVREKIYVGLADSRRRNFAGWLGSLTAQLRQGEQRKTAERKSPVASK